MEWLYENKLRVFAGVVVACAVLGMVVAQLGDDDADEAMGVVEAPAETSSVYDPTAADSRIDNIFAKSDRKFLKNRIESSNSPPWFPSDGNIVVFVLVGDKRQKLLPFLQKHPDVSKKMLTNSDHSLAYLYSTDDTIQYVSEELDTPPSIPVEITGFNDVCGFEFTTCDNHAYQTVRTLVDAIFDVAGCYRLTTGDGDTTTSQILNTLVMRDNNDMSTYKIIDSRVGGTYINGSFEFQTTSYWYVLHDDNPSCGLMHGTWENCDFFYNKGNRTLVIAYTQPPEHMSLKTEIKVGDALNSTNYVPGFLNKTLNEKPIQSGQIHLNAVLLKDTADNMTNLDRIDVSYITNILGHEHNVGTDSKDIYNHIKSIFSTYSMGGNSSQRPIIISAFLPNGSTRNR